MEFAHSRLHIITDAPVGCTTQIGHLGNVQRPTAGAGWTVKNE